MDELEDWENLKLIGKGTLMAQLNRGGLESPILEPTNDGCCGHGLGAPGGKALVTTLVKGLSA